MTELTNFEKLMNDLEVASEHFAAGGDVEMEEAVDKSMAILHMINQWSNAYPENIFIPMTSDDWELLHRGLNRLRLDGWVIRDGSAAAADCMRYVVTRMKESMEKMA